MIRSSLQLLSLMVFLNCCIFSQKASAQLNVTTGYDFNYQLPNAYNKLIDTYKANNAQLDKHFGQLKVMHGVQLGLRYNLDNYVAFELGWKYRFKNFNASGLDTLTNEDINKKLFIRQNVLSLGIENSYNLNGSGSLGYGVTIDYNLSSFKIERSSTASKATILKAKNFASTFFLSLNTGNSGSVKLSIRPYIQVPWSKFNLNKIDVELNESTSTNKIEEGFMNFGITLLFINGG